MSDRLPPLANVLRSLRAEQGVDQLRLALAMNSVPAYLSKLENGHRSNPGARFLRRYAEAYTLLGRPLTAAQRETLATAVLAVPAASVQDAVGDRR